MKKKKVAVLHAQVPFIRGGAESHVENLVKHLRRRGYDADLVSIPFKWYPGSSLLDSYMMWRIADLSESNGEKIDLVIPLKVPTYAARHPNKVSWIMHQFRAAYDLQDDVMCGGLNTIPEGDSLKRKIIALDNKVIRESKLVFANSKNVAKRLKQYNNIDSVPLYHPPAHIGKYYCDTYGDYILSVGRLDKSKRVDLLVRALQYCGKNVKLLIAGKGPEEEPLKRLAKQLQVEAQVKFLGFVPDDELLKLYANALAVCFVPIDEDYGYITLEAFLSRKTIITCADSGGVLEFAVDQENSFVVHADPEELGRRMEFLYGHVKAAEEMGTNGYEVVKNISWDHVIDELTKTIR